MATVMGFLAEQPVLFLFMLIGVGMIFGHIKVKGVSLGAAAVLFCAIGFAAWGETYDIHARVPHGIGILGLAIFAFAIGINSGPSFFRNLKAALGPIIAMVGLYIVAAGSGYLVGTKVFDMPIALVAGTFAGATTNTPALAAAGEASGELATATVGYSIAYLFGVIGMMIAAYFAIKVGKNDKDTPSQVTHATIRVEREDSPTVADILHIVGDKALFSRLRRGETGPIWIPELTDHLEKDDLVTVAAPKELIAVIERALGHISSHSLRADRRFLDFRRITVSDGKLAGHTIAELDAMLEEKFGATISRVRRGDIDQVATPEFFVEMGDRVRVVGPTAKMKEISKFFGDSARGLTDINPVAFGIGMMLGVLLGEMPIPMGGGATFSIGSAAGTLIVGLIFGRIGRIGPIVTTLPHTSCLVLSELGLLMFLAQAGTNAGGQIAVAFEGGTWLHILALGAMITTIMAVGMFFVMRLVFKMGGTQLSGVLGGSQTQPAVLGFANNRTHGDPRVALGYALVYPVAMIGKILVAQVLGSL